MIFKLRAELVSADGVRTLYNTYLIITILIKLQEVFWLLLLHAIIFKYWPGGSSSRKCRSIFFFYVVISLLWFYYYCDCTKKYLFSE